METVERTADNDNDKASKYFQETIVKPRVYNKIKQDNDNRNSNSNMETNPLILKLKQQTQDNRETNEALVKQRTAMNDQVNSDTTHKCVYMYI